MSYQTRDYIFDLEVLENFTSNVAYQPATKRLYVAYNTYFQTESHNRDLPQLTLDEDDRQVIRQAIEDTLNTYFQDEDVQEVHLLQEHWKIDDDGLGKIPFKNGRALDGFSNLNHGLIQTVTQNQGTLYGFNSEFYDNTLLAYFEDSYQSKNVVDTYAAREVSNQLIEQDKRPGEVLSYRGKTTFYDLKNSYYTVDIKNLNEKMSRVALKRLIAQKGGRIQTSQKLKGDAAVLHSLDDVVELLTYNVSDVLGTKLILEDTAYQEPLATGTRMIEKYKDNRFKEFQQGSYKRLKRDTTSANFIEAVIAPTKKLDDDDKITLAYPMQDGYIPPLTLSQVDTPPENPWEHYQIGDTHYKVVRQDSWQGFKDALPESIKQLLKSESDATINGLLEDATDPAVRFTFFYESGQPKVVAKNGQFVPVHGDQESFNAIADQLLFKDTPYETMTELHLSHKTDDERREALENLTPTRPDAFIFMNLQTGHPRINFHDGSYQMDLLEWVMEAYHLDAPYKDQLYRFYDSYRGADAKKDNIKSLQDPDVQGGVDLLMPYGSPAYATVSIGGIHGNLVDRKAYEADKAEADHFNRNLKTVQDFYRQVIDSWSPEVKAAFIQKQIDEINQSRSKESTKKTDIRKLQSDDPWILSATLARLTKRDGFQYGEPQAIQDLKPDTFTSGSYKVAKFKRERTVKKLRNYSLTLDGYDVYHADITSYYPTLITTLEIFKTGESDPYKDILDSRIRLKSQLPGPGEEWTEEHTAINNQQLLDKLLLNSASGKADARSENNIQVNNKIHRMRIVGQLIMLTLCIDIAKVGGVPNSINTDGVFVHNIDLDTLEGLLETWCHRYRVDADAEHISHFISKSSNDRVEIYGDKVGAAGGGQVSYHKGPHLNGLLSKPAITDHNLVFTFLNHPDALGSFHREELMDHMKDLINQAKEDPSQKEWVYSLFQYITASNPSTNTYIVTQDANGRWIYHSQINRLLYVTEDILDDPDLSPWVTRIRKISTNKQTKQDHPEALRIAQDQGLLHGSGHGEDKAIHTSFTKIPNLDSPEDDQLFLVVNEGLKDIPLAYLDYLDLDKYADYTQLSWTSWSKAHQVIGR